MSIYAGEKIIMKFVYDDGGRDIAGYKGHAGDCVCRSITIVSRIPYQEIYERLSLGCQTQRMVRGRSAPRSAREGIHTGRKWFKDYMKSLGLQWVPTMGIGTGCKVHLNADELPAGRLVVAVSRHYTAVVDGVIHDTHNPSERGSTIYSPGYPLDQLPKKAIQIGDGGKGWVYSPERCVYGYWRLYES